MTIKNKNLSAVLLSGVAVVTAALVGCGPDGITFEQPELGCIVHRSNSWVAGYTFVPAGSSGSCTQAGELIGVQKYSPPNDPLDLTQGVTETLSLRPGGVVNGGHETAPTGQTANNSALGSARGLLTEVAGDDVFCHQATPTPAELFDSVSGNLIRRYEFTNVRVLSKDVRASGAHMVGDVKITIGTTAVCNYHFNAVWPAVSCAAEGQARCEAGRNLINPLVNYTCLPTGFCGLAADPPNAFK